MGLVTSRLWRPERRPQSVAWFVKTETFTAVAAALR